MLDDVQLFYDAMAARYEYIFPDWQQTVSKQGKTLAGLLTDAGKDSPADVLDVTCGIGTQTLGLALQGYRVHGTDLSPQAIERAKKYALKFVLPHTPTFAIADLLKPTPPTRRYPIVISCDNAVAHFHSDDELKRALQTMLDQLEDDGLLMLTVRDYDALMDAPPRSTPIRINDASDERILVFQVWDWDDSFTSYRMELFFLNESDRGWQTQSMVVHMRAWQRKDITRILQAKGLTDIRWFMPEEIGYYQPVVIARKTR